MLQAKDILSKMSMKQTARYFFQQDALFWDQQGTVIQCLQPQQKTHITQVFWQGKENTFIETKGSFGEL